MIRRSDAAQVVVAAAVLIGFAFALRPEATPTLPPTPPPAPAPSEAAVALADQRDATPDVLFIGDSYTAGNSTRELSPGCLAALDMGWLCNLSAVPGTGYISGGPANRFTVDEYVGPSTSFAERIPGLAAVYQPDVVVLDGGRNDEFAPKDDVFKAMSATIADVQRAWPTAQIVFSRPRFLGRPNDDLGYDEAFVSGLAAASGVKGLVTIDPITWFADTDTAGLLGEDGIHPNQQGEAELGDAFTRSLLAHGFTAHHE